MEKNVPFAHDSGCDKGAVVCCDANARRLSKSTKVSDPFPSIPPSLLNSADFTLYAGATGMLYPFPLQSSEGKDLRKPASYEVSISGEWIRWDSEGHLRTGVVCKGGTCIHEAADRDSEGGRRCARTLELPRNSIVYVQLAPMFRLPVYIAVRYNLAISHIYKGLLVGTGPLVDPGFEGHIYLPIHNLTNNHYTVDVDEGVVWMEFTKLSPAIYSSQRPVYVPSRLSQSLPDFVQHSLAPLSEELLGRGLNFPAAKRDLDLSAYLAKAAPFNPIQSSMQQMVTTSKDSQRSAKEARDTADRLRNTLTRLGILGGVAVLIALVTLWITFVAVTNDLVAQLRTPSVPTAPAATELPANSTTPDQLRQQGPTPGSRSTASPTPQPEADATS